MNFSIVFEDPQPIPSSLADEALDFLYKELLFGLKQRLVAVFMSVGHDGEDDMRQLVGGGLDCACRVHSRTVTPVCVAKFGCIAAQCRG